MKSLKVALVCDWLTGVGGAERVVKAVHQMYPDAPIYTSQYRPDLINWFDDAEVRTGWLNKLPAGLKRFVPFLRQLYFSNLDLSEYDLVISITGAEAKGVKTGPRTLHISYMHAPTQYYWTLYDQYIDNPGFGFLNPLARLALRILVGPLRKADYKSAQHPDVIVANSSYIKDEIKKYYGRESEIIWPNVDVEGIEKLSKNIKAPDKREGFIIYGRQVSWKRMDLAIRAAVESGEQIKVIGSGPEHDKLVDAAGGSDLVTFLPKYNGLEEIITHIKSARAYIFPSVEPFGIAPVESLAAGTPVIALNKGGARDFINEDNGIFFQEQTVESIKSAIKEFESKKFETSKVVKSAEKFSDANFKKRLSKLIEKSLKDERF